MQVPVVYYATYYTVFMRDIDLYFGSSIFLCFLLTFVLTFSNTSFVALSSPKYLRISLVLERLLSVICESISLITSATQSVHAIVIVQSLSLSKNVTFILLDIMSKM